MFAHIDFSGDAAKVGLRMRPAQLLIFDNPKSGTPVMVASPSIALDLIPSLGGAELASSERFL